MKKFFVSLFLTMSLILCLFSVSAFAENPDAGKTENQIKAEEALAEAVEKRTNADLTAYKITDTEFKDIVTSFRFEYPELFWLNHFDTYTYLPPENHVLKVNISYNPVDESQIAKFNEEIEKALSVVDSSMSEMEKALLLHDYLVLNVSYDKEAAETGYEGDYSYRAYGALVNKKAVCEGYAAAYSLLLNRCGIANTVVQSDTINHAWNMVKLNGNWYHVDVTWEDPTDDQAGRVMHTYFLLSDKAVSSIKNVEELHRDWTLPNGSPAPVSSSTKYDDGSWWKNCTSGIFYLNGKYYFLRNTANHRADLICRTPDGKEETLHTFQDKWHVWERSDMIYTESYARLAVYRDKLYINGVDKIYRFDPVTRKVVTLDTLSTKNGYICGLASYNFGLLLDIRKGLESEKSKDYTYYKIDDFDQFEDVSSSDNYYDAVKWAWENDVTKGISETRFGPKETCSRGQVVTFLWRANGRPEPKSLDQPFVDVKSTDYYSKAVLWAVEQGITKGTSDTEFSPNASCTEAQIISFLWRSEGEPASDINLVSVNDRGQYYSDALAWGTEFGLISKEDGLIANNPSPRSRIVTYLYKVDNAGLRQGLAA